MRTAPLAHSLKNTASSSFNKILSLISDKTNVLRAPELQHPFFAKKVKGLVIASPDTFDWSLRVQHDFAIEFASLYQNSQLELETIYIKGGPGQMQSMLLNHPKITGAIRERFSFVLTPGYTETTIFNEVRSALHLSIKQLYCVQGSLTAPFRVLRDGIAGVHNAPMDPYEYVLSLKGLIPFLKTVCIAYMPFSENPDEHYMIQQQRKALRAAFIRHDINVLEHPWSEIDLYANDLKQLLNQSDALITIDEHAMQVHRASVIDICNELGKPLCASELDSVFAGAALGCGITREAFAKPMLSVLHDMMFPQRRLVSSSEIGAQVGMRYNLNAMRTQGIVISDETAALMRMKSIYDLDIITLQLTP